MIEVLLLMFLLAIGVPTIILIIDTYNELVRGKNEVKNSWADIDVQLNRRMDLIPNLVETVKGYATHEKDTLTQVTQARAGLKSADTVKDTNEANNMLTETLNHLFAVAEQYPDLKANTNFQNLQNQLRITEDKIAQYREIYNNSVLKYNNQCESIPTNIIANYANFKTADFFETTQEARTVPKVKF